MYKKVCLLEVSENPEKMRNSYLHVPSLSINIDTGVVTMIFANDGKG